MTGLVVPYLHGALSVACLAVGIKFLKYYRLSHDRFFVWFAIAFWTFAVGATIRVFVAQTPEHAHLGYLPRLLGFLLIIIAIIDKNRRSHD